MTERKLQHPGDPLTATGSRVVRRQKVNTPERVAEVKRRFDAGEYGPGTERARAAIAWVAATLAEAIYAANNPGDGVIRSHGWSKRDPKSQDHAG